RVLYFGSLSGVGDLPLWATGPAILLAVAGTSLAPFVIERMTDHGFRQWTRAIIFAISAVYLVRGGWLFWNRCGGLPFPRSPQRYEFARVPVTALNSLCLRQPTRLRVQLIISILPSSAIRPVSTPSCGWRCPTCLRNSASAALCVSVSTCGFATLASP